MCVCVRESHCRDDSHIVVVVVGLCPTWDVACVSAPMRNSVLGG